MEEISKALSLVSQLQTALSKNVCSEVLQDEKLWERFDVQCSQNVILFLNVLTAEEKEKFMKWGNNIVMNNDVIPERNIPSPEVDSSGLRKEFVKPSVSVPSAPLPYIDMRNLRGKSKADIMKISQTLQKIKRGDEIGTRSISPPRAVSVDLTPPPPQGATGKDLRMHHRNQIREQRRMLSTPSSVSASTIPQSSINDTVFMPSPSHFNTKRDFVNARDALQKANPNKQIAVTEDFHKLALPAPPRPETIIVQQPQPHAYVPRISQGKKGMILPTGGGTTITRQAPPPPIFAGMAMHRVTTPQRVR